MVCERGCCDSGLLADCCDFENAVCRSGGEWWCGVNPRPDDLDVCEQCVSSVIIADATPPVITCPDDIDIECDESTSPSNTGIATATDECDSDPSISFSDKITPGECPDETTITRTWTASDAGENTSSCIQIINTEDNSSPIVSCNNQPYITPPDAPISFMATAEDDCDDDPFVEITKFDCFKYTKRQNWIDKKDSCLVRLAGGTITILDTGGVGDNITYSVLAVDICGNEVEINCGLIVDNPGNKP